VSRLNGMNFCLSKFFASSMYCLFVFVVGRNTPNIGKEGRGKGKGHYRNKLFHHVGLFDVLFIIPAP
jgi:hypothetical protein